MNFVTTKTIAGTNSLKTILSAALLALCFGCAMPPDPIAATGGEFLRACCQQDWDKAEPLDSEEIPRAVKERFGGAELAVRLGSDDDIHSETSRNLDGRFRAIAGLR